MDRIFKLGAVLAAAVFVSCSKWGDYTTDFDYSAVYFAYQNQLRTVIAQEPMQFEFGVYLAGRRENRQDEWVRYRIEPDLLSDASIVGSREFTLLPEDCYTLSSPDVFNIPEGSFLGTSALTFDIEKFTSLENSTGVTYALPVRIYETSVDSILVGSYDTDGSELVAPKDYAVIAVKYINPYHGNYYVKGTRYKMSDTGEYVVDSEYSQKDLSQNMVIPVSTVDLYKSVTTTAGGITSAENDRMGLLITVASDGSVAVEKSEDASSMLDFKDLGSSYEPEGRTFNLAYEYTTSAGSFKVEEQFVWRDTKLKFEQW